MDINGGYVYLLDVNGDNLLHKIGVTRISDPRKRIKKLQTGNGNQIRLCKEFYSSRPFKLEKMLHNHYKENREEGEWFLMSQNDVDEFIDKCNEFENIIKILKDNPFF